MMLFRCDRIFVDAAFCVSDRNGKRASERSECVLGMKSATVLLLSTGTPKRS